MARQERVVACTRRGWAGVFGCHVNGAYRAYSVNTDCDCHEGMSFVHSSGRTTGTPITLNPYYYYSIIIIISNAHENGDTWRNETQPDGALTRLVQGLPVGDTAPKHRECPQTPSQLKI